MKEKIKQISLQVILTIGLILLFGSYQQRVIIKKILTVNDDDNMGEFTVSTSSKIINYPVNYTVSPTISNKVIITKYETTNSYDTMTVSTIAGRETILPSDDATPTWDATNMFAYLNVTQNVIIAVDNILPDTVYTLYLDNTNSKTIAFDTDILYFGIIGDDLNHTNIINFTLRNDSSVILAKGVGAQ